MNIKIDFFKENIIDAIGAGVYEVDIKYDDKEKVLYIGESVFVIVRCASHLYNLKKNPNYFGFNKESIKNPNITLSFHLIKNEDNAIERKRLEKELIKKNTPLSQSGIGDRQKSIEEKILALTNFLEDDIQKQ